MQGNPVDVDALRRENEQLRQQNDRLCQALAEVRAKLTEPEEIIRAIRQGEIDALVVEEQGEDQIYSIQAFDSAYRVVVEECFPFGVWLARPDGSLHYVSPSFLELLGASLEELNERGQFSFLPPETRGPVERRWAESRRSGRPFNAEYTVCVADGSTRTIWTQGMLVRTHDGQAHWVGVNIDVTERNQVRDELRQQAEALREADRRKDEFLALLGHELRNPLAVIHNGVQILLMPGSDPSTLDDVKRMMHKQVEHLARMVDDLLDVSRITRGKIDLRRESVDLATIVNNAVTSVGSLIESQQHTLQVSMPPEPVALWADPTRLEQILVNLLSNAAKYTRPGGRIGLSVGRDGDDAVIRVADNGLGLSAEILPSVFDLFVQVGSSLDRTQGGLGIGLTLVKNLVELHGGTITAASEGLGKGSEFVVRLPVAAACMASARPSKPGRSAGGKAIRVLVVDDSEDIAKSLRILLELHGHEVAIAHDGPAGLAACRAYRPDIVLLDIGLPGMSGYEVASQLRHGQDSTRAILVAMTGYGQEADKQNAHEAGFDLHVTKPVDVMTLKAIIASAPTSAV